MKKYDFLRAYFYAEQCRLENDIAQLQDRIRYRRISVVDCLELILAAERLSAFVDISAHVKSILKITDDDDD